MAVCRLCQVQVMSIQLTFVQASSFSSEADGLQNLICCSTTNTVWNLWLASVITGNLLSNRLHALVRPPDGDIRNLEGMVVSEGKHAAVGESLTVA